MDNGWTLCHHNDMKNHSLFEGIIELEGSQGRFRIETDKGYVSQLRPDALGGKAWYPVGFVFRRKNESNKSLYARVTELV